MGLLDQAKEFVGSEEGKSMMNKIRGQGVGGAQEDNSYGSGMGRQSNQSMNDDSMMDYQKNNDNDYQSNDNYNSNMRQNQSQGGLGDMNSNSNQTSSNNDDYSSRSNTGLNNDEYSSRSNDGMGTRSGVSSGGVNDSYQSVGSGGYGTNDQGDSFSRNNQSGFNNEDLNSSSGTY